jgi:hypothetical protein
MNNDPFAEYGAQKSIQEAIEELCTVCLVNSQAGPVRITFPKQTFEFYKAEIMKKIHPYDKYLEESTKFIRVFNVGRVEIACED